MKSADGHVRVWLAEHSILPWPWRHMNADEAQASDLYAAYKAALEAEGHPAMSITRFGSAIDELGYEKRRESSGIVYPTLSLTSRRERARRAVTEELIAPYRKELARDEQKAHMARVPHVKVVKETVSNGRHNEPSVVERTKYDDCRHRWPDSVAAALTAKVEERTRELQVTGVIDAEVERQFGPYLDGHPAPDAEWLARHCMDRLDVLTRELGEQWRRRSALVEDIVKAREEYLERFDTDDRRANGSFIDPGMAQLDDRWHFGEASLQRLDADIERVTREAEQTQRQLGQALDVLDRVSGMTDDEPEPEVSTAPVEESDQPVW